MTNHDNVLMTDEDIRNQLVAAMKSGNEEDLAAAMAALSTRTEQRILAEFRDTQSESEALRSRGVRMLTPAEKSYFTKVIDALKDGSGDSLTGIAEVMPRTTYDSVFEELRTEHPLLSAINFVNTTYMTEWILNTNEADMAQWGPITGAITKALSSGFERINMLLYKLTAYIIIPKSFIALGPEWLERYVREVLSEALACGLEFGAVDGTGKDMPIGMSRQIGPDVVVTGGVYPYQKRVGVESFSPVEYGTLISNYLATTPHGRPRKIANLLMVVNPWDYASRIMPATTMLTPAGSYARDVLPIPTNIVQSVYVPRGEAILGIANRYFMGMGLAVGGKIEHDDSVRFFEDDRVYAIRTYGNGRPKDGNSFIRLDISALKPLRYEVYNPTPVDPDPTLESLSLGSATLSPTFAAATKSYTATTTSATNKVSVAPKSKTATVEIKLGDAIIANGGNATWAEGSNTLTIKVTDQGETETYTVTVTKS